MPKGERNSRPPMVGVFFEGTREQFGAVAEIAALVNEEGITVERVKQALGALKAVEQALGAVAAATTPKKRATKRPGPKPGKKIAQKAPVAKKRKYTRRAKPGTEEAAAK
jgi:hypothetical protein